MLKHIDKQNPSLSEDMIEEIRNAYRQFSPDLQTISLKKLPQLFHALKIQISDSMLKDLNRWLSIEPTPGMTFKQFINIVSRAHLEEDIEEEIRTLFYNIDKGNSGCLDAEDLLVFIRDLEGGDAFSEEDVDELIKQIDEMKVGYVNYEDLVYALLPK